MANSAAGNGRFCEMATVTPQKRQCELGSYYPARTFVKPPPRKAAGTLCAIQAKCEIDKKTIVNETKNNTNDRRHKRYS